MKKCIFLSLFLMLFAQGVMAQFGFRIKYNLDDYGDLNSYFGTNNIQEVLPQSLEIGIDYWKRLKNHRVEFYPEISYATANSAINNSELQFLQSKNLRFNFNTNIYLLDFKEDCDCPTFSKDGNIFTKGFHLILSPGIEWSKLETAIKTTDQSNFNFNLGAGVGLDIGINDLLTMTPFLMYRLSPQNSWSSLAAHLQTDSLKFSHSMFQMGIRIGIRADYNSKRRFR